jgi:hypothetical protein
MGGGASVGLFVSNAKIVVDQSKIVTATGGAGGNGVPGAPGSYGSVGAHGRSAICGGCLYGKYDGPVIVYGCINDGSEATLVGGPATGGAKGGQGGTGAGGAGGPSFPVAKFGTADVELTNSTLLPGTGGGGGTGSVTGRAGGSAVTYP